MTPRRLLTASLIVPIAAVGALALADIPAVPVFPRAMVGLAFLAGVLVAVQSAWLALSAWRSQGTVLYVRDGGLSWSQGGAPGTEGSRRVRLQVASGQAVVLERLGRFSRVLAPGRYRLLPGESVFKVVSVQPRAFACVVDCATKDGIPLDIEFEFRAELQATGSPGQGGGGRSDANWSAESVARAAYQAGNWEGATIGIARSTARELVAREYLVDLLGQPGKSNAQALARFAERARVRIAASARNLGVNVPAFTASAFRLPPALEQAAAVAWNVQAGAVEPAANGADSRESLDSAALVLAPVISRSGFTTIRKALREAASALVAGTARAAGRSVEVSRMEGGADSTALRPGSSLFALEVREDGFADLGVRAGDLVVVESGDALTDDGLAVVLVDERPTLRRCWQKPGHTLLTAASARVTPIAVVDRESGRGPLVQRYRDQGMPVDVRLASQVKIIGAGRLVLRQPTAFPIAPGPATSTSMSANWLEGGEEAAA